MNEDSVSELWDNVEWSNTRTTGVPEDEGIEGLAEKNCKNDGQNFLNSIKL